MILGAMIQELRKDRNLDQKDLAKLLHVSIATVSNYETEKHMPSIETLVKLSEIFNVSTDYLLGIKPFCKKAVNGWTFADIFAAILKLPPKRLIQLIDYLEYLQFYQNQI